MKLATQSNNVLVGGGIGKTGGFGISMGGKMITMLSDTIYQDKIGSMVRELACNGVDAHIVAGFPTKPITIHVPDSIEPWFSVKDEGIGISDEDMFRVYTMYGESTKDNSNDTIGAFGLGSKTPFAYTDQFTVTSIHGGMKRIYVAAKTSEGATLIKQAEMPTDEHPGLEVNVSVNPGDFTAFGKAIVEQLKFFAVKPNLINNRYTLQYPDMAQDIHTQNNGITVYKGTNLSPVDGIWIVQGGVGYELSISKLGSLGNSETAAFVNQIANLGAVLEFDIGQIEVTASREGISYTEKVCKRIIDRINDAAQTIAADGLKEIKACANIWDRTRVYNDMISVTQKAIRQSPEFETLFGGMFPTRSGRLAVDTEGLDKLGYRAAFMQKVTGYRRGSWNSDSYTKLVRQSVTIGRDLYGATLIYPEADVHVFVKDTNSKPVARIRHFAEKNNYPRILIIEAASGVDISDADIAAIEASLCMTAGTIKRLTTLEAPKVVRVAGQNTPSDRPVAYRFNRASTSSSRDWEVITDIDETEGCVWVEMERHNLVYSNEMRIVMEAAKHGKLDVDVVAVNGATATKIRAGKMDDLNLISVQEAAAPLIAKIERVAKDIRAFSKYKGFAERVGGDVNNVLRSIFFDEQGVVTKVHARMVQLQERIKGWQWVTGVIPVAEGNSRDAGVMAAAEYNKKLFAKYPLLQYVHPYKTVDIEVIRDYMEMVDKRG